MSILLTASNMIIGFISVPYVTRVLSVEGYGDVSFAQNIAMWLQSLCMFGVGTYGIRECAKVREDAEALATVVKELLIIVSVSSSMVLSCFALCIVFIPKMEDLAPLLWMFLVSTFILSYGVEWYFQAIEQYRYITVRSVAFKLISLILMLLLVTEPDDYLVYGGIVAFVQCGNNLLNFIRLNKMINLAEVGKVHPGRHLSRLSSFALLAVASSAYMSLDSVILGMVSPTNYQVGLYQLVGKLKNIAFQVLNAVLVVFIPRLSFYKSSRKEAQYKDLLKVGLQFTLASTITIGCLFLVLPGRIISVMASEKYLYAIPSLQVIGLVNLLSCLGYFISYCILIPCGREKLLTTANMVGLVVSLLANYSLDPLYGALGAAFSMMIAELAIVVISAWGAKDELLEVIDIPDLAKLIFSNLIASTVAFTMSKMMVGPGGLFTLILLVCSYILCMSISLLAMRHSLAASLSNRIMKWN